MAAVGLSGGFIASLFGGWDAALTTLVIFMAIDYLTGVLVAAVFQQSNKSVSGALDSKAGLKGLCRKVGVLVLVLVASHLDNAIGTNFVKDAVVIGFIANEGISIIENAGLMGVPIPNVIRRAIEVLKTKAEKEG